MNTAITFLFPWPFAKEQIFLIFKFHDMLASLVLVTAVFLVGKVLVNRIGK